jgi:hypothetical protein
LWIVAVKQTITLTENRADFRSRVKTRNGDFRQQSKVVPHYNTANANRFMAEATHPESFEQIVEWAYRTLPQTIQDLPDFPGIQVADEPPEAILKRKNWPQGREILGCYSGIHRTVRQHNQIRFSA